MSKITLNNIGDLTSLTASTSINANNDLIETAIDNTLSRDGTSPNQMQSSLDMNNNQVLNLPPPASNSSPVRVLDLEGLIGGSGVTLPPGGTTDQSLVKTTNADYIVNWEDRVSSVGLSAPSDFTITNSPVTSSGNLTASWTIPPTGAGAIVRGTSPTLVAPILGTPASGVATNLTGTAAGLTAGHVTTNANLTGPITSVGNATSVASQTGTGSTFVMSTSPALVTPNLGTPSAGVATNLTGTAAGLTAGNVTTNANLTGVITSVGNATSIAAQTGTGSTFVVNTSPILVTPNLGTPSAAVLTNATGLPTTALTGTLQAAQEPAHTGDATNSAGSLALTLATVNSNVGTFGSATASPAVTVNGKGLITAVSNTTVTPAVGSITGLGTGVATFLATPSSANLVSAVTDETGSGALVFGTSPTIASPTFSGTVAGAATIPNSVLANSTVTVAGTSIALGASGGHSVATNSLTSPVTMTTQSTYYDGPSIAQGSTGTWFASGMITVSAPAINNNITAKLWDGTTLISSGAAQVGNALICTITLSGYLASPAGNLRISATNNSAAGGTIATNNGVDIKSSTISAVRIA